MRRLTARIAYHNRFFLNLMIMSALLGFSGCGYKTIPVPPGEIVPQPVTDLRYELNERGVTLSWTFPAETVRGESLTDISSFQLYRAVVPADQYCETCPLPFGEPIQLSGGAVPPDVAKQQTYSSTLLRPGHLYFFKVRSKAGWWAESEDSNVVSFMWNIPPKAPEQLAAEGGDGTVTLQWTPVTTYIDGTPIHEPVLYRIHRSIGTGPFTPLGELQDGVRFEDTQVVNGRKYRYMVQAVTMYEKGQVGGGSSQAAAAVPVDRTAPAVPAGVRAVRTAAEVKVVWEAVESDDLQGYRIYRRTAGEDKPVQIGEAKIPYTMFSDTSPPAAENWFYSVSSFDNASPPNESERSAEVPARR
ncbi:MAG: hypothetical protein SCH71_00410 [Desulfobulbaceae bacterium]|nr:hypothetical protein [Desulfobulbaceae bacterium]